MPLTYTHLPCSPADEMEAFVQQAELEAAGLEDGEEDEEGGDDEGERCCPR